MAKYSVSIDGTEYEVEVVRDDGKRAVVKVDGQEYTVDAQNISGVAAASVPAAAAPMSIATPPRSKAPVAAGSGAPGQILAPLAGLVLEVCVSVGQSVNAGEAVVRLEAMKMENDIKSEGAGTVKEILVSKGDEVQEGQALVVIEG